MLRVALTGGMAAGKSVASRRLGERGLVVIDADQLARDVVAIGTPGLARVVAAFGPGILAADGALDRARMAELVFADDDARARLEAIVHPLVREAAGQAEQAARQAGDEVVVFDIPLLVESGQAGDFDVVVTVSAPPELRLARAVAERGLTLQAAQARLAAQADDDARQGVADIVLDGSGSVEALRAQVDPLVEQLLRLAV